MFLSKGLYESCYDQWPVELFFITQVKTYPNFNSTQKHPIGVVY